ncbi:MSMEG_0565 family glycosyltransferase [Phycicoccus sp. CSK15P-2]|uniref:MSMEG_0565 family glycosyltransferase n=1 Tax=Phycicoccus sp. CSK15P-2 TaxID=2807627 RepID=UPI00194E9CAD|nr:MSMEG_0565 family glycosyltransferase [Phycicoccus sp. CSK15P-2]MBM6402982.1 MSMEG_0565 family glycosyltransferase [Phycicoccus sp. CSK15P-2]
MRVALLTYSTKPRGGVVHTLALAESLAALGVEVEVWTLGRGGDAGFFRPVDPAVTVHAVPFPERADEDVGTRIVRSIHVLRDAFDPGRYDIVHAQDCISANAALPCLRTVHHLDTFTTPELAACHERALVEPTLRICVSAAVAEEVRSGWGLEPVVIPNGVDAARFAAGADDRPGRARWADRLGPYVLALGGIEPRKGSVDLLRAMAATQQARPDVRLVYAGGETLFDYRDYRVEFDAVAVELGIDVEVLGVIDEPDLPALVAQAEALGFVSTKEGFGLAAMEALAAGVPVVARDLPVLREVLGEAVTYARTPDDIAARLLDALEGRHPGPQPGRDLAARFTWAAAARAHLDLYTAHLARGTEGPDARRR